MKTTWLRSRWAALILLCATAIAGCNALSSGSDRSPHEPPQQSNATAETPDAGRPLPSDTSVKDAVERKPGEGGDATPAGDPVHADPIPLDGCATNADCDDGLFCNGAEVCVAGNCILGVAPCDLTTHTCDEAVDACRPIALPTHRISGRVTSPAGAPLVGIAVAFTGSDNSLGADFQAFVGASGDYAVDLPRGWSGTLSAPNGYQFTPNTRRLTAAADRGGQNFVAVRHYFIAPDGFDGGAGTLQSPLATLHRALELAGPGDTIYLRGGTYIGDGQGFGRLAPSVSGMPEAWLTITNYNDEHVVIDRVSPGSSWTFMDLRKSNAYIRIQGLEIVNFAKAFNLHVNPSEASLYGPPHHIEFVDIHVHHCGLPLTSEGKAFRIRDGAHHITLRGCEIHDVAGPGVAVLDDCHNITFIDTDVYNLDDGRGIDGDADGFTIDDSLIGEGAVTNRWPAYIRFENCRVWDASEDGIDVKADHVVIDRCQVWSVGANAYKLWSIADSRANPQVGIAQTSFVMSNSLGYDAGESCLEVINQPDARISNCTFVASDRGEETIIIPRVKPYVPWTGRVYARNNIFVHLGLSTGSDSPVRAMMLDTFGWELDLDYNVYAAPNHPDHTILRRVNGAPGTYYGPAAIDSGAMYAAEGFEQNGRGVMPRFEDAEANDYRLSPADTVGRNTGFTAAVVPPLDLDGANRVQGGGIDRGCYERP
jgi:hypothetical protein